MKNLHRFIAISFLLVSAAGFFSSCSSAEEEKIELKGIILDTTAVKSEYFAGDRLNLTNLSVTARYSDGSTRALTTSEYTTSPADRSVLSTSGSQNITVIFEKVSNSFSVNVTAVAVNSLSVNSSSVKVNYYQYQKLNLSNLTGTAAFNNGTSKKLTLSDFTCTPANGTELKTAGTFTVTVKYGSLCKTFSYQVNKNYISDVSVTFPDDYSEAVNLLSYEDGTFTANDGYKTYAWWLNGTLLTTETSPSYTPDSSLEGGVYSVMVLVTDSNGTSWSATGTFTITK